MADTWSQEIQVPSIFFALLFLVPGFHPQDLHMVTLVNYHIYILSHKKEKRQDKRIGLLPE